MSHIEAEASVTADHADENFTDGEKKMAATQADKKKSGPLTTIGSIAGKFMPMLWVVILGIMLRLTGIWTGQPEITIPIPAPFDGYSFSSTHVLMTVYTLVAVAECRRVSAAGLDQTRTVVYMQTLAWIQLVLAVAALIVLGMLALIGGEIPEQPTVTTALKVFTVAFANIESIIYGVITYATYLAMIKINAQTLKRSFIDGGGE